MATKVYMEALSPTMEEGQVVRWLKAEGDAVAEGDVLAEIETDKATMELVARGEGVLRRVFAGEGAVMPVGEVIGVVAAPDEDISALEEAAPDAGAVAPTDADRQPADAQADARSPQAPPPDARAASTSAEAQVDRAPAAAPAATPVDAQPASPASPPGRVKASPVARRLAKESDLDIGAVAGSGPGGRIVKRDVEAAVAEGLRPAAAPPAPAPSPDLPPVPAHPGPGFVDVPLSQMRKTVARRLVESLGPVPHFYLTVDVDMKRALAARARVNELLAEREEGKASLNDLVIKAAAAALVRHPACNAWWQGDSVRRFDRVHMGVAVAVPGGLVTPVVRDAHLKGLGRIGAEVRELAARAREKKLRPEEYTGSTFSISNLGMFGIEEFTAVINPPEAGILAVGTVEDRPVARDGQVVVRPRMRLTMSCDHRAVDGAVGAAFLATLKAFLEEPAAILA